MTRNTSSLMFMLCALAVASIMGAMVLFRRGGGMPLVAHVGGSSPLTPTGDEDMGMDMNVEKFDEGKRLVVFHAQWCGHCTELLKEGGVWEQVKAKLPGVSVEELDEANSPELVQSLDVSSFPDVRILDGDSTIAKFEGDRTVDAIVQFAMEHVK